MYRALGFQLNFSYGSGGTSVNAWLQTSLDGGTTWCDAVALGQLTTASARVVGSLISSASYALTAATDGALTAGTLNNGLFGPLRRVTYTSIGTYAGNSALVPTATATVSSSHPRAVGNMSRREDGALPSPLRQ